jgi:hypothetical protein
MQPHVYGYYRFYNFAKTVVDIFCMRVLYRGIVAKADITLMNASSFGFGITTGPETLYNYSCRSIGNGSALSWFSYVWHTY